MALHTPIALEPELQKLVDARLDTIDRMLVGRVPRTDRQAIIKEVESQIEELLAEKEHDALGSEELLEVLARLDPPEAYLVAGGEEEIKRPSAARSSSAANLRAPQGKPVAANRFAMIAGILGILSLTLALTLTPVATMAAVILQSEAVLYCGLGVSALLGIVSGISALIGGLMNLGKGAWPITAIATGALSIAASIILPILVHFIV